MYDGRTKLADQVTNEVRKHFGDTVLRTVIPRSVKVSEAPGYSQTVLGYDPGSRGAMSYVDAAREIAEAGARTWSERPTMNGAPFNGTARLAHPSVSACSNEERA